MAKNANSQPSGDESNQPADAVRLLIPGEETLRALFSQQPERGFAEVFRRYHGVLCQHAFRFVNERETAKDLVADVFTQFWQQQTYQTITTSYRAYLFRAVRSKAIDVLRHRYVEEQYASRWPGAEGENDSDAWLYEQDLLHRIEQTLAQLPPRCRQVFSLNRFEGKTYAEIAAELSISVKAVEGHISKALVYFRKALHGEHLLVVLLLDFFFKRGRV